MPESLSIDLFYALQKKMREVSLTMANYVGVANASDRLFIAALCEAAYKAMSKGAQRPSSTSPPVRITPCMA
jgi:hypothetical protein